MKASYRFVLFFLFIAAMAIHGLALSSSADALETFQYLSQKYSLFAKFSFPQADIILQGPSRINLSAGMGGENILLGTRIKAGNFRVFWLNYRDATIRLAFYDYRRNRSRLLPLSGFSFIGFPEVIEEKGSLQALVFLGNRSDNDDIFYFEPETDLLLPLTHTPFSEKNFSLLEKTGQLEIETKSLWAQYRYRLDLRLRESVLLEEKSFPSGPKSPMPDSKFTADNTYIGFGDSITWGQIEGEQRLDLCYLTQLQFLLAPLYGPWDFINLGLPAQTTYDGAQRVDQELSKYSAPYFLLMLGVNDVWRNNFSLASSLENLEYIADAALARGRKVIISTLTPRKDRFSLYEFYWDQLHALSNGILDLAKAKNVASIDTLAAFMNSNPPDGWKALLEEIIPDISKGNHPNAEGHRVIASLFAAAWVANELPVSVIKSDLNETYWKDTVTFDGSASTDKDGFIVTYAWDFGDGETAEGEIVSHQFVSATAYGDLQVKLTVTDDKGGTASATKVIKVKPLHAVIASSLNELYWRETAVFYGTNSVCADGSIVTYAWDFGDGEKATGVQVDHQFASATAFGDLPVKLTVTDDKGRIESATKIIKVKPRPFPVIKSDRAEIFWQETVAFDGRSSLAVGSAIVAYEWNFGDGEHATGSQVTHKFANSKASGDLSVQLTVTNAKGVSAVASKTIKVKPRPFPVIHSNLAEIFWQGTVVFDGSKTLVLPGFTVRYSWDFGDGEYALGMQVSHPFTNAGAFGDKRVKLTVVDNKNASASVSKTIKVKALYTAPFTFLKVRIRTISYDRWGYKVNWTANAKNAAAGYNIVKYRILRKHVSVSGDYIQIAEMDASVNSYLDLDFDQAADYIYAVCAVDASGHVSPVNNF